MNRFIFLAIIAVAIFLRFFQLGVNPPSLDWDEASLGYNAYSILKTGADEYGNKLPLAIRSFDDYKPPLYVYLTVPAIELFGLNEFAVRLPSAILGVVAIFATYFLTRELFKEKKHASEISIIAAAFLAVSPWHLQFSRAAFEGNIGLTFFILGMLFFLKGLKNGKLLIFSGIAFILSMYSYHSFRLIIPVFLLVSGGIFQKELLASKKFLLITVLFLFFAAIPMVKTAFLSSGVGARLSMVTIFAPSGTIDKSIKRLELDQKNHDILGQLFDNRRVTYTLAVVKGYLDHFNPDFLFIHGDGGRQHHAVDFGMLYLWDLPFIAIGFVALLRQINKHILFLFSWFFLAPIASAISTGTPHPVRAIAMIPAFQIFTAVGLVVFYLWVLKKKIILRHALLSFTFLLFIFNILYYFHQYYVHTPIEYGDFWQYGNKQAIEVAGKIDSQYEKVIMTYAYDQPYIYYLFYQKTDPRWYQQYWRETGNKTAGRFMRDIGKYEFRNINWEEDKKLKNTLFIGTKSEIPDNATIIKEIYYLDGTVAYRIAKT